MRKKMLILCEYFPPAERAGGPLRTLEALALLLSEKYNVFVVAKGFDFLSMTPLEGIELDRWSCRDGYEVYFTNKNSLGFKSYKKILKSVAPDLIYLNSFFSPRFSFLPLLCSFFLSSPVYVCSPRGELSKHALAIKPFRKMLYCILTLPFWIRKFSFIASSEKEKIEILNSLKISPIRCAVLPEPTLKYVQTFFVPQKKSGELKIIFMARINRIKNLDFAISCVAECENVSLDIYGPINSNEEQIYWKECKKLIDKNNLASRVRYHGPAASESVHGLISCAHVLFAPSSSENFGHSILESLSCGRPVLISDQTPWTSVQENGAGFAFSLKNTNAFIKSLNYLKELKHEDFLNLCKNALRCSTELYSQEGASLTWLDYSDEMLSRPTIKGFGPE